MTEHREDTSRKGWRKRLLAGLLAAGVIYAAPALTTVNEARAQVNPVNQDMRNQGGGFQEAGGQPVPNGHYGGYYGGHQPGPNGNYGYWHSRHSHHSRHSRHSWHSRHSRY